MNFENKETEKKKPRAYRKKPLFRGILKNKCCFCQKQREIEELWHLNVGLLYKYLNSKCQINGVFSHSLCSLHQRKARQMIIRARHLHLIPYTIK